MIVISIGITHLSVIGRTRDHRELVQVVSHTGLSIGSHGDHEILVRGIPLSLRVRGLTSQVAPIARVRRGRGRKVFYVPRCTA